MQQEIFPKREKERAEMEKERQKHVYLARLAEQAERYDGIHSHFTSLIFLLMLL